jgi:hypothetical protein
MAVRKPPRTTVVRSTRSRTDGSRKGDLSGKAGSASQRLRKRRVAAGATTSEEPPVATAGQDPGVVPATEVATEPAAAEAPLDASEAVESQPVGETADGPGAAGEEPAPATEPLRAAETSAEPAPAADSDPPRAKRRKGSAAPPSSAIEAGKPARRVASRNEPAEGTTLSASRKVGRPAKKPPSPAAAAETSPKVAREPGLSPAEAAPETAKAAAAQGLGIAQALTKELTAFSQRLLEDNTLRAKELAAARRLPELVEIQARQLQAVSEAWLRHTARLSEIYLATLRRGRG